MSLNDNILLLLTEGIPSVEKFADKKFIKTDSELNDIYDKFLASFRESEFYKRLKTTKVSSKKNNLNNISVIELVWWFVELKRFTEIRQNFKGVVNILKRAQSFVPNISNTIDDIYFNVDFLNTDSISMQKGTYEDKKFFINGNFSFVNIKGGKKRNAFTKMLFSKSTSLNIDVDLFTLIAIVDNDEYANDWYKKNLNNFKVIYDHEMVHSAQYGKNVPFTNKSSPRGIYSTTPIEIPAWGKSIASIIYYDSDNDVEKAMEILRTGNYNGDKQLLKRIFKEHRGNKKFKTLLKYAYQSLEELKEKNT